MDGAMDIDSIKNYNREDSMKTIKLDGVEYQAEAEVIKALTIAKNDNETLSKDLETIKKDSSKLEAERDDYKDKLDAVNKELEELKNKKLDTDEINKLVKARQELISYADKAGVEVKEDEVDVDIKKKIIVATTGTKVNLDEKDESYIDARYDGAIELLDVEKENEKTKTVQTKADNITKSNTPSTKRIDAQDALKKAEERLRGGK
jgi:tetrahydromethanopterin S-methyltransferase subunit B